VHSYFIPKETFSHQTHAHQFFVKILSYSPSLIIVRIFLSRVTNKKTEHKRSKMRSVVSFVLCVPWPRSLFLILQEQRQKCSYGLIKNAPAVPSAHRGRIEPDLEHLSYTNENTSRIHSTWGIYWTKKLRIQLTWSTFCICFKCVLLYNILMFIFGT
jgi:hypothetical protein